MPAIRLLLLCSLFLAPSAVAERIRVVVAVAEPEVSALAIESLRTSLVASLETATDIQAWGRGPAFAAEIDSSELERLQQDSRVQAISIDTGGSGGLLETLPLLGVPVVRAQGYDGAGVTIAIFDTGIDLTNPDFAGRVIAEQCFCDPNCCPNRQSVQSGPGAAADDNGHGTHVAGIVASSGSASHAGVAPAAKIVAVKVMDAANGFQGFTQIYRGLEWIATQRPDVRIINMSLGTHALFTSEACNSSAIGRGIAPLIRTLRDRGVLITASTGNQSSTSEVTLPACMTDVIGVGATYKGSATLPVQCMTGAPADRVTCFTNSNDAIDLLAPGASILSSRRGGGSMSMSGTSMAAPHVAGTIALMLQARGGFLAADQIEQILKTTGKSVTDTRNDLTFTRIDAASAVAATPRVTPEPRRRSVRN
jgi:subtilisin family serine protease